MLANAHCSKSGNCKRGKGASDDVDRNKPSILQDSMLDFAFRTSFVHHLPIC